MIITKNPLRVSLFGGGSDFEEYYTVHGGAVLTTTIDKYVYVIIKERFDDKIVLNYKEREIVDDAKDIKHDLIRESMMKCGVDKGIEITTLADIPSEGTGLGSSSSILVGLLHALHIYKGELVTSKQLAEESCDIEIGILKKPIGKQDQYIAAYGGLRYIRFGEDGVKVEHVKLDQESKNRFNDSLMLYYTGINRKSENVLIEQKNNIIRNVEYLKALSNLAVSGKRNLEDFDIAKLGELLNINWEYKKKLSSNITNLEIEEMYKKAMYAGALGCKICGAGAGGFMLIITRNREHMRNAMSNYKELPINLERDGTKVILNTRK